MKMVLVAPLAALALAGAGTGAYFWVTAEGGVEEQPPSVQQPTPTPTPAAPEPTPPLLAQPSPQPVPADWLSYTDPNTGVTLRYPPDWVVKRKEPPLVPAPRVDIYKPVANPPPRDQFPPEVGYPPRSALVSLSPPAHGLAPGACDLPPERTQVAGYPADRCVYSQAEHPLPGMFPNEGAFIQYVVHTPAGDLYFGIVLYTVDATGTVLVDSWSPEDQATAEQIVQSLEVR